MLILRSQYVRVIGSLGAFVGLLSFATNAVSKPIAFDQLHSIRGGDPGAGTGVVGNSKCINNAITCTNTWGCSFYWDYENDPYCVRCDPRPFAGCVPTTNPSKFCSQNFGINGNEQYCGDLYWGEWSGPGGCAANGCLTLWLERGCGAPMPISLNGDSMPCDP
jgi:hypothetical protein